jgi:type I restriction enzyme S subunit
LIIKQLKISVPPIEEQRAIASALSDMDALLAKLDQLIAKKRDIKQAAMQELLTGRRRLPGFSGGWTVTALRNLGAWKGGATPSMANPDFWVNGDVPWASSGDIKSTTIDATAKNITELAVESSSTTVVPAGSVVMVTRSGILRRYFPVAKTSKPIAINQDIKALIPASGVDTEFVLQSLLLHGPDILSSCMKAGTTVESVELSWLKAYEIDLPSLDEQQAIAALLRDMAAEITALEARREKTRLIKQGMMQELLSGRVRLI